MPYIFYHISYQPRRKKPPLGLIAVGFFDFIAIVNWYDKQKAAGPQRNSTPNYVPQGKDPFSSQNRRPALAPYGGRNTVSTDAGDTNN